MMPLKVGCVLRVLPAQPEEGGPISEAKNLGRVLHIDAQEGKYYWLPFPERTPELADGEDTHRSRTRHYIPGPQWGWIAKAHELEAEWKMVFPDWEPPAVWDMSDAELKANSSVGMFRQTRRRLDRWLSKRDSLYALIKPIVQAGTMLDFLNPEWLQPRVRERAQVLGHKNSATIVRTLRMYMLGGCVPNALLPRWDLVNVAGHPKCARLEAGKSAPKPGRKNRAVREGRKDLEGKVITAMDRDFIRRAWKAYKVRMKLSVEKAYEAMLNEFYASSCNYDVPGRPEVTLPPCKDFPTLRQFAWHGPGGDRRLKAARINLGEKAFELTRRGLVGSATDEYLAAGFGLIDSTCSDQNLVSVGNRHTILSSPWDTKLLELSTGYILGIHCGFEPASTLTSLIAVAHSVTSKVAYCRDYGVEITDDDWLSLNLASVTADNGEVKGEEGIATLSDVEITAEFVRAYRGDAKGPVESAHNSIASDSSDMVSGTTRGERLKRGDEDPARHACRTFHEYMPDLIRAVLKHNNVDQVPHLMTNEMRRDKVEPTRGAILKWKIDNGRIVTAPPQIDQLRAWCLPRMKGKILANGIELVDPRPDMGSRHVPYLCYWSEALHATGLTERARKRRQDCELLLDPDRLGTAWLRTENRLIEVNLRTNDPEMATMTLLDWLLITDEEGVQTFLNRHEYLTTMVSHTAATIKANQRAQKAKADAAKTLPEKPRLSEQKAGKRDATKLELEHMRQKRLGLDQLKGLPKQTPHSNSAPVTQGQGRRRNFMDDVRNQPKS
jgi:hypothetical protein